MTIVSHQENVENSPQPVTWYNYIFGGKQEPKIPELSNPNSCGIDELREYTAELTKLLLETNTNLGVTEKKLNGVKDITSQIFTRASETNSLAYDKLKELYNRAYDIKHSVFTTLPDSKVHAANAFPEGPVSLGQRLTKDHFDALYEHVKVLCTNYASEDSVRKIDESLSKMTYLMNMLSVRKVSMIKEISERNFNISENFQLTKEKLQASFDVRHDQFESIHARLIQSRDKLSEFCIEGAKTTSEREKAEAIPQNALYELFCGKSYKTGFESQPKNLFHRLISEYLAAKEAAEKALEDYHAQCNETLEVFKQYEEVKQLRDRLVQKKMEIDKLIQQQAKLLLPPTVIDDIEFTHVQPMIDYQPSPELNDSDENQYNQMNDEHVDVQAQYQQQFNGWVTSSNVYSGDTGDFQWNS